MSSEVHLSSQFPFPLAASAGEERRHCRETPLFIVAGRSQSPPVGETEDHCLTLDIFVKEPEFQDLFSFIRIGGGVGAAVSASHGMADLGSYGNADRDIEQALIALKKGAQLLKYGRKGKPKVYPFRLSNDETSLIWISSSGERSLKLASVSRIIPGQRTAVFQRYLRPEKEYLSFSLIYDDGKRSLDLICKDKVEAEIWIAGLKALTSSGQAGRSKIDGWSDGAFYFDDNSNLTSSSQSSSSASATRGLSSPDLSTHLERSHVAASDPTTSMQAKASNNNDTLRVSVSSAPSTSSHGSAPDDCDALGDVYIWGEVVCDLIVKSGPDRTSVSTRADILSPRPLESNVVLDVHYISCGVRHAALVTRMGEVFSWGEESGGRLGHGVGRDAAHPRPVDSLASCGSVDLVACGEFHTCAVTTAGELYTWGDGTHHAGLLGHGPSAAASHWIPRRVAGPLDGLRVASVTCGPWHTALITSAGRLFTFGDGTFGALGHGDRESATSPREVESLTGLRTVAVACGVWHTAAVVEVIATQPSAGKLFTWGDGDKNRLGHGDREARLKPTCVPALIDHNFQKVACGHSLTLGLTTAGRVFAMGSMVYGQLGNPQSDGKLPCLVGDKLAAECVEEISCGAYHVAVLTSKNEVYTWGKGANGRLGHGDLEDRKSPMLVEGLKDRHVKSIACGSNYTSAICVHKWVSGAEQSQCSACRQAFGFTRKRHNCYNCGLVHCHACSSRKAVRAALAPDPGKPHRVCDPCYAKLAKVAEGVVVHSRRNSSGPRLSGENKDRLDKADLRLVQKSGVATSNSELIKQLDSKAGRQGKKGDTFSLARSSQVSLLQLGREAVMSAAVRNVVPKPIAAPSSVSSRSVSPFSRKPSPPRSATPVPTTSGLSFAKSISDSLRKTNEVLNQEVHKLRVQVENLKSKCELQELELQQSAKNTQEAMAVAAEESAKCKAAKEVIKSLTAQVKDMAERLPPGAYDPDSLKLNYLPNGCEPRGTTHNTGANGETNSRADAPNNSYSGADSSMLDRARGPSELLGDDSLIPKGGGRHGQAHGDSMSENIESKESISYRDSDASSKSRNTVVVPSNASQIEAEWIEQYEPGVYITLVALSDGTRDLKRVRFSRRRFGEHQAETWWSENRERVYEKYNVRGSDKSSVSGQAARRSEGAFSPSSQV
ncbi:Regulator of chromosome condensation (RCC1) family with FYVE zinc finger domain [Striga hermonthica]|uniref:Regulator of chromosome condensation (RCC1) family with FYVE zinc finger domain n=1 Tax=Striga hermonthica TaxID=68872 RepID=A0A9N7NKE3_STRHE|nr:Regulator of chromosome condensation (RCC1) family with FYVE zinc finger domain [Striga hermonthica]